MISNPWRRGQSGPTVVTKPRPTRPCRDGWGFALPEQERRSPVPEVYQPSPRHKEPWQPGARGSLCPRDVDGAALFAISVPDPNRPGKRYATDGERAFCAHPDNVVRSDGGMTWHGFPYDWRRVPLSVQRQWVQEQRISRMRLRG